MTTRRFTRRARNPVRRIFVSQAGSSSAIGTDMIDLVIVGELTSQLDSQFGDVLITGIAGGDLTDEYAIHQLVLWVGRTSTSPGIADTGVRTRQYPANEIGTPFVFRIRGLRVNPGELMKMTTSPVIESSTSIVHQNVVHVKWSFREMRQG